MRSPFIFCFRWMKEWKRLPISVLLPRPYIAVLVLPLVGSRVYRSTLCTGRSCPCPSRMHIMSLRSLTSRFVGGGFRCNVAPNAIYAQDGVDDGDGGDDDDGGDHGGDGDDDDNDDDDEHHDRHGHDHDDGENDDDDGVGDDGDDDIDDGIDDDNDDDIDDDDDDDDNDDGDDEYEDDDDDKHN